MTKNSAAAPDTLLQSATTGATLLVALRQLQQQRLRLSVAAGLAATLLLIGAWYLIAVLVQLVIQQGLSSLAVLSWVSPLTIMLLLVLRAFCLYLQERLAQDASQQLKRQLRQQLLTHWQTAPFAQFQGAASQYASHYLEDIDALEGYYARYWPQQQLMLLTPLCILIAVATVNWLVAALLLLSAPLIPLFMSLIGMGAEQINQRHLLQRQRLAGHFLDRLKKLALIQRLGAAAEVQQEVASRSDHYRQLIMKTLKVAFLSSAVLEFFSSVAIAAVAIYIGFSLFGAISFGPAATLTLTSGLFILALAPEFFQPLRQFAQSYHDKAAALAAANQLAAQLSFQETSNTSFSLQQLQLSSAQGAPLHLASALQLQKGQAVVINGPSGVGKSTLLKTLAGLLPDVTGLYPLTPTRQPTLSRFYMAQRPWLVNGSIRANLQLLSGPVSDQALLAALQQVGLARFCDTAAALERPLTERGEGLSGGQLQRLALARAFLTPYDVIYLDEPTASLDASSRQQVIAALSMLKQHCILVVVSHDPEVQVLGDQQLDLGGWQHAQRE